MIDDRAFYNLADNAHFCFGAMMVFMAFSCFPHHVYWITGSVAVLSGLKEWLLDPREETPEVAGSGMRDWLGYLSGIAVALIMHYTCNR